MADNDFMTRIQLALDLTPRQLANALDIPFRSVVDRHGQRAVMSNYYEDPFWPALSVYVDERIGGLLAVREELTRKAALDRRSHKRRHDAIRER
jgi:hypothetical protein